MLKPFTDALHLLRRSLSDRCRDWRRLTLLFSIRRRRVEAGSNSSATREDIGSVPCREAEEARGQGQIEYACCWGTREAGWTTEGGVFGLVQTGQRASEEGAAFNDYLGRR